MTMTPDEDPHPLARYNELMRRLLRMNWQQMGPTEALVVLEQMPRFHRAVFDDLLALNESLRNQENGPRITDGRLEELWLEQQGLLLDLMKLQQHLLDLLDRSLAKQPSGMTLSEIEDFVDTFFPAMDLLARRFENVEDLMDEGPL